MLPRNIICQWCETTAGLDKIQTALLDYLHPEELISLKSDDFVMGWREKTLLTFGRSEWSSVEGSLLFENRRAIVGINNVARQESNYVIFAGLFDESINLLRSNVSNLIGQSELAELQPVEFELGELTEELLFSHSKSLDLSGAAMMNQLGERISFSSRHQLPMMPSLFHEYLNQIGDEKEKEFFVSDLYLQLRRNATQLAISHDGRCTFPEISFDKMIEIIQQVSVILHSSQGETGGCEATAGEGVGST